MGKGSDRPNYKQPHNITEKVGIVAPNSALYDKLVERHHARAKQDARYSKNNEKHERDKLRKYSGPFKRVPYS